MLSRVFYGTQCRSFNCYSKRTYSGRTVKKSMGVQCPVWWWSEN